MYVTSGARGATDGILGSISIYIDVQTPPEASPPACRGRVRALGHRVGSFEGHPRPGPKTSPALRRQPSCYLLGRHFRRGAEGVVQEDSVDGRADCIHAGQGHNRAMDHARGGRPLGPGRQLPPQLTVGRRPLGGGGGGGGGGLGGGGSRRGAGEGRSRGGGGSRGSRGGGGVGQFRTVGYAAQV